MKKFADESAKNFLLTIFVAVLTLISAPVMAQTGYGDGAAASQAGQQQTFDEQTLQKFALVSVELGKIQNKFSEKLRDVQDPEKATTIQREMGAEMLEAAKNEGITVETYNAVANQMGADPQMRNQMEQRIQELNN